MERLAYKFLLTNPGRKLSSVYRMSNVVCLQLCVVCNKNTETRLYELFISFNFRA